jgi:hypothetical protein
MSSLQGRSKPRPLAEYAVTHLSIEILTTLVLFHSFASWINFDGVWARCLGLFLCCYVLNDWMTTRSSHAFYSDLHFFSDVSTAFLLANAPGALRVSDPLWGYSPSFWLLLGSIELIYAGWNFGTLAQAKHPRARRSTLSDLFWALLSAGSCFLVFILMKFTSFHLAAEILAGTTAIGLTVNLVKWNLQRIRRSREAGASGGSVFVD